MMREPITPKRRVGFHRRDQITTSGNAATNPPLTCYSTERLTVYFALSSSHAENLPLSLSTNTALYNPLNECCPLPNLSPRCEFCSHGLYIHVVTYLHAMSLLVQFTPVIFVRWGWGRSRNRSWGRSLVACRRGTAVRRIL